MAAVEFSELQKDAIAEVMNISMGNAATAASDLLNAKVWITTPRVSLRKSGEMHNEALEPAVCVKIEYIKGIIGSNLMVLKQSDVQLILNQLMGQPLVVTDDFEFDELNISAVSEVMNQMMGSSATALSNLLGFHIDISTPTPYIMDEIHLSDIQRFDPDDYVISVEFDLSIEGVIRSEFVSVLSVELAQTIADNMLNSMADEAPAAAPIVPDDAGIGRKSGQTPTQQPAPQQTPGMPQMPQQMPGMQQQVPQMQQMPQMMNMQPQMPQMQQMPQVPQMMNMPGMNGMNMGMPGMPQMPYGYPPMMSPYGYGYAQPPVNIQSAQLDQFDQPGAELGSEQKKNLQLLMGVPMQIAVEIGTAKRKVKDILEFTQGTIIELERQAGAPVDVVVNGNLIARGDVVVIDDNFAVRITEILKSKFMDSLGKE
jgi:flagellar motor switch protein FliN/FliY